MLPNEDQRRAAFYVSPLRPICPQQQADDTASNTLSAGSLNLQRIDPPKSEPVTTSKTGEPRKPSSRSSEKTGTVVRRPDPVVQSVMLLLTMGVMLMAARFAVPRSSKKSVTHGIEENCERSTKPEPRG